MKAFRYPLLALLMAFADPAAPGPEAMMDRIEATVVLPPGTASLSSYGRYYAWEARTDGVRKVRGIYVREPEPSRHWVNENELPLVMDGGCDIVSLTFDLATDRIEWVACNSEG